MKKFFIVLLLLVGCQQPPLNYVNFKITIIAPSGKETHYYNIRSAYNIYPETHFGGQITFKNRDAVIDDWEKTIVVPNGWYYRIEQND